MVMDERSALLQSAFLFVVEAGERFERTPLERRSSGWLEAQAEELAALCAADPSDGVTVLGELAGDFAEQARDSLGPMREARSWSTAIITKAMWALRVTATGGLQSAPACQGPPDAFLPLQVLVADQAWFAASSGGLGELDRYVLSPHQPVVLKGAARFLRECVPDSPATSAAIALLDAMYEVSLLEVDAL